MRTNDQPTTAATVHDCAQLCTRATPPFRSRPFPPPPHPPHTLNFPATPPPLIRRPTTPNAFPGRNDDMTATHPTNPDLPPVFIAGGAFAGIMPAKRLAKAPVRVTLVDRRNHHVFQPLLYQVATAALSPA